MNYTYILRCADGSYYTGWTTDPEKRLQAHNAGKGAKYTREEAMRRERQIKQMTRQQKQELIDGGSRA